MSSSWKRKLFCGCLHPIFRYEGITRASFICLYRSEDDFLGVPKIFKKTNRNQGLPSVRAKDKQIGGKCRVTSKMCDLTLPDIAVHIDHALTADVHGKENRFLRSCLRPKRVIINDLNLRVAWFICAKEHLDAMQRGFLLQSCRDRRIIIVLRNRQTQGSQLHLPTDRGNLCRAP